jgi:hypothetical protein
MSRKRSVWKNKPDGTTVRRNTLAAQFCSRPKELLESPALRVLSRTEHLLLIRIELELRNHGGHDNGKLPITKQQFGAFGIHTRLLAPGLRALEALGIIRIAHGRGGNAEHRQPNRFLLNYLCGAVDTRDEITNAWNRIKTIEEAEQIARVARKAKDRNRAAYGRRLARKQNIFWGHKVTPGPGAQVPPKTGNFRGHKVTLYPRGTKCPHYRESRGGGRRLSSLLSWSPRLRPSRARTVPLRLRLQTAGATTRHRLRARG